MYKLHIKNYFKNDIKFQKYMAGHTSLILLSYMQGKQFPTY